MKFDISVLEYLGKVRGGILVLLGIVYQGEFYEATFFYNSQNILLTLSEELESQVGDVKKLKEYPEILKTILRKIVPFNEMYDRLDEIDFGRWVDKLIETKKKNPLAFKNRKL